MSELYIESLKNKERVPVDEEDMAMNERLNAFARIYYSCHAFDLGRAPTFRTSLTEPVENNYTKDAMRQMFMAVMNDSRSRDEKVIAVHDAWTQNYLHWSTQPDYLPAYDSQLVPFRELPAFEKKKRYFVVDLVAYIMNSIPKGREQERFYAVQCMDLATYIVAYDLLQQVPDPNQLIEMHDADYLSSNLL
jgi:hypothetical protein